MKVNKYISVLLAVGLALMNGCHSDEPVKEIFLEGEPIPGIEIFFPLGFYDAEPLMPKISPDGKKLLFTGPASLAEWKGLWVMDLETREKILLHPDGELGDWSPTSDSVVFIVGSDLFKMGINNSDIIQLTFNGSNFSPDWSPDGDYILYDNTDCGGIIDPIPENSCGLLTITSNGNNKSFLVRGRFPTWGENMGYVVYVGLNSELYTYDLTATITQLTTLNSSEFESIRGVDTYSALQRVVFYKITGTFHFDVRSHTVRKILPNQLYNGIYKPKFFFGYPSWHPDGEHIIYENFEITRSRRIANATHVEGTIRFYKLNVASALNVSNLSLH